MTEPILNVGIDTDKHRLSFYGFAGPLRFADADSSRAENSLRQRLAIA